VISLLVCFFLKTKKNIRSMATKRLGEVSTPNNDFLCAIITIPNVKPENYEIKPKFLV
jgi:hypothetical protein